MTEAILYIAHAGAVCRLTHVGEPGEALTLEQARDTLTRYRDRARAMDGNGQHCGAALSDRIADEIAHAMSDAALQRAEAGVQQQAERAA